jgi:hypothetical protein
MSGIQESAGQTAGNWQAPRPSDNANYATGPFRIAQTMQSWRGFNTWNKGMGLTSYPEQRRDLVTPQPANQIYLSRNPAAFTTASPIPIGQYVLSQQIAFTGGDS